MSACWLPQTGTAASSSSTKRCVLAVLLLLLPAVALGLSKRAVQSALARTHFDAVSATDTFGAEVQQLPVHVLLQLLEHAGLQTASEGPVLKVSFPWWLVALRARCARV